MDIGIVGAGSVGATCAYSIATAGLARRLVLADKLVAKAEGEAMDLRHCASFIPNVQVDAGPLEVCEGLDLVVVTAGIKRREGELRTDLIRRNLAVFGDIALPLARANPDAVFLVVSNPVDLLTLYALRHAGLPAAQVIGTGTLLDSSRLRHLLATRLRVDPRNVHAYILGEHGPGSVAVWSEAAVGGVPVEEFARDEGIDLRADERAAIFEQVVGAGQSVIARKGATFYGIAQSVLRIATAIGRDEHSVLTVSCDLTGIDGHDAGALSLPAVIGRGGVLRRLSPALDDDERARFHAAAEAQRALAADVGIV